MHASRHPTTQIEEGFQSICGWRLLRQCLATEEQSLLRCRCYYCSVSRRLRCVVYAAFCYVFSCGECSDWPSHWGPYVCEPRVLSKLFGQCAAAVIVLATGQHEVAGVPGGFHSGGFLPKPDILIEFVLGEHSAVVQPPGLDLTKLSVELLATTAFLQTLLLSRMFDRHLALMSFQ